MSITAIVENDTIKLPPDVHLPDGTKVNIEPALEPESGGVTDALGYPAGYFEATAGSFANEPLDRPAPLPPEKRPAW